MSDDNPQGTVTTDDSASSPASSEAGFEALAGNFLGLDPEEDNEDEEAQTGSEEEADEPEEGDSDEEDDADQEDGGQPRDEKGRFLSDEAKVRMEDGSVVTLKDLKQGNLRQADYTRKTQEIAEQRRSVEAENQRVQQLESQLAQQREYVSELLAAIVPQEPPVYDPNDPVGYMEAKANYDQWQAHVQALNAQRQEAQQRRQHETTAQFKARIAREQNLLLEAKPEWRDEAKATQYFRDLEAFAKANGFEPHELRISDHRAHAKIFWKAIAYDKLQAQKPKAQDKAKGKPPLTPGRRQTPEANSTRAIQRDRQTLKSTRGQGPAGEAAWENLVSKLL